MCTINVYFSLDSFFTSQFKSYINISLQNPQVQAAIKKAGEDLPIRRLGTWFTLNGNPNC